MHRSRGIGRQKAEKIFEAALDLQTDERSAYVDAACGDDPELRAAVKRLLAADAEAEGFLHQPAIDMVQPFDSEEDDSRTPTLRDVPTREEPRFVPGHRLAERYRIVHLLGRGGMGEVYRADDLKLCQPVALKFLPAGLTTSRVASEHLLDEARLARRVTHPRICRIYDIGEAEGLLFLSMELVEGETLAELLRRIGRLPPERAVEIALEVCEGLAEAHAQGILHRDLKPANLLLDADGHVRISDFGLALLVDSMRGPEVRSGTPAYMAPEQHLGREVTERSDIYALGLVLYEMLIGERPFGGHGTELARQHCEVRAEPPSRRVEGIDPAVERVVLRCLAKDPADRPASAETVSVALRTDAELAEGTSLRVVVAAADIDAANVATADNTTGDLATDETASTVQLGGLLEEHGGSEALGESGPLWLFARPWDAVRFAFDAQRLLPGARLGVHLGEIELKRRRPSRRLVVSGAEAERAEWLASLAHAGQTLLTLHALELARQATEGEAEAASTLRWLTHGEHVLGDESLEVFEVIRDDDAPLAHMPLTGRLGPSALDAVQSKMGDLPQESMGQMLQQTTEGLRSTSEQGSGDAAIELPVLTVIAHPDARRIGHVAILGGLGASSGQEARLSRGEPAFGPPGEVAERPLAESHLSRRPLRWRWDEAAGTLHLDCGETSTRVLVDGEVVRGGRDFSPETLARGIVLVLAERVALVLRSTVPFPSRQLPSLGMVGECDAMVDLRRDVQRVCDLDATVLLRGETGTGKELVARAIHGASLRRGSPFVVVDAATLSPGAAMAKLFGCVEGGSAEGGTLLLDGIGETPSEIQALLLRALETATVRILAATDVDLEAAAAAGRFREALLHRLSGYEIQVPPLRERREDFGRLVYHFLAEELDAVGEINRLMIPSGGKPWLPAKLVAELALYEWPGNVRQLRNVARQLVVANRGGADFHIPIQVERLVRG